MRERFWRKRGKLRRQGSPQRQKVRPRSSATGMWSGTKEGFVSSRLKRSPSNIPSQLNAEIKLAPAAICTADLDFCFFPRLSS